MEEMVDPELKTAHDGATIPLVLHPGARTFLYRAMSPASPDSSHFTKTRMVSIWGYTLTFVR